MIVARDLKSVSVAHRLILTHMINKQFEMLRVGRDSGLIEVGAGVLTGEVSIPMDQTQLQYSSKTEVGHKLEKITAQDVHKEDAVIRTYTDSARIAAGVLSEIFPDTTDANLFSISHKVPGVEDAPAALSALTAGIVVAMDANISMMAALGGSETLAGFVSADTALVSVDYDLTLVGAANCMETMLRKWDANLAQTRDLLESALGESVMYDPGEMFAVTGKTEPATVQIKTAPTAAPEPVSVEVEVPQESATRITRYAGSWHVTFPVDGGTRWLNMENIPRSVYLKFMQEQGITTKDSTVNIRARIMRNDNLEQAFAIYAQENNLDY